MASKREIQMRENGGGSFTWPKEWPTPVRHARTAPMMNAEGRAVLAKSLKRKQRYPILLSHDGERLLDGRNRYVTCMEHGIEPVVEYLPEHENEADVVEAANEQRQHLLMGQRVAVHYLNAKAKPTQEQVASRLGCAQSLVSQILTGAEMLVADGDEPNLKTALQEIAWGTYKESDLRQRRTERKRKQTLETKNEAIANDFNMAGIKFLRALEASDHSEEFLDGALRITTLAMTHNLDAEQAYRLVNGTVIPGDD